MRIRLTRCLMLTAAIGWAWWFPVDGAAAETHDLRVVIDVSGSMKETDPHNLRVPALRLLTELLPPDTQAGVWTFGQWVNMLVPHGAVSHPWKDTARHEAAKINSVALYTDIGQALQRAARGWDKRVTGERRSLVLLTDGKVDIDKNPEVNVKARRQVLEERLPELIQAGVTIYPVGLSDNADRELLETLARRSGGLYQVAGSAEELQQIFLNILEQSTQANTLPIVAGGFQVDGSIDELNVVVFHTEQSAAVALRDPGGGELTAKTHPAAVRWFDEQRYTVVTVPKPTAGQWQIVTDPNPQNRVFVVSRLHVVPEALPESLFAGEEIVVAAAVMDGEVAVTDSGFLQLLETHAVVEQADTAPVLWPMPAAQAAGHFQGRARFAAGDGLASVSFVAEGPTFHRSVRRLVKLVPGPVTAHWEGPSWVSKAGRLTLGVRGADVASDQVTVSVLWEGDGARYGAELPVPAGQTRSALFTPPQAGSYRAAVAGSGVAADGRPFLVHLPPMVIEARVEPPPPAPPPPESPIPAASPPPPQPPPPPAALSHLWWALGAANLLLALAALYYALRVRRRDLAEIERRFAQLADPEPDETPPAPEAPSTVNP